MKRLTIALAWIALCGSTPKAPAAELPSTVVVRGPTVVAFCAPETDAEMEKNPDKNEALADFQVYAARAREPLRKAGIEFHEVYVRTFRLRDAGKTTTFRPGKIDIGYYFVAPGRKPRIEYGVLIDADILQNAQEYFGSPVR